MLKKGANVNVTQFRRQRFYYALDADRTPLMKAIEYEDTEFFDQVIARGANLEAKDLYGRTALMQACNSYRDVFAIKLANLGANAKARDNVGATPMMYIRGLPKKYTELINALQAHGADINDVDNYQRNIFERIMEDSYFWTREHDFLWSLDKWALQWAKMGVDADVVGHSTFSEYHWVLDKYPALKDVIFWDNWNKQQAQKDKKPAAADADSDDENGNGCQ
jgi:hypothetical protein